MAQYARPSSVEELPPEPERVHYRRLAMDKRALLVVKNSKRGRWTKYAWFTSRETAVSKGIKYRNSASFREAGVLAYATRFDPKLRKWILYLKYETLRVTQRDIDENIVDAGGSVLLDSEEIGEIPEG